MQMESPHAAVQRTQEELDVAKRASAVAERGLESCETALESLETKLKRAEQRAEKNCVSQKCKNEILYMKACVTQQKDVAQKKQRVAQMAVALAQARVRRSAPLRPRALCAPS
jgi:chromosome segregation ATPase